MKNACSGNLFDRTRESSRSQERMNMLVSQTRFCEQVLPPMMMSEVSAELDPVKTTCWFTASDNLRFRHQLFEALEELRVRRVGVVPEGSYTLNKVKTKCLILVHFYCHCRFYVYYYVGIDIIVHYSISQAMDSENEERIKQLMFEKYHLKTKLVSFHGSLSSCAIKVEFC